jgi:hypothetical protein
VGGLGGLKIDPGDGGAEVITDYSLQYCMYHVRLPNCSSWAHPLKPRSKSKKAKKNDGEKKTLKNKKKSVTAIYVLWSLESEKEARGRGGCV